MFLRARPWKVTRYSLIGLVFLTLIGPWLLVGRARSEDNSEANATVVDDESQDAVLAQKVAAGYVIGNFDASLRMREKVDFLLSPALLVQEAIRDDVILTYPQE